MNEKSHHSTDVSATQGDKQGRAGGGRREEGERGWQEGKKRVCVFSSATPFQDHGTVAGRQGVSGQTKQKRQKKKQVFFFHVSAPHVREMTYFHLN